MSSSLIVSILFISAFASGISVFFVKRDNANALKLILSFSGSYLFAITVLHLIPHVYHTHDGASETIGLFVLLGFLFQLIGFGTILARHRTWTYSSWASLGKRFSVWHHGKFMSSCFIGGNAVGCAPSNPVDFWHCTSSRSCGVCPRQLITPYIAIQTLYYPAIGRVCIYDPFGLPAKQRYQQRRDWAYRTILRSDYGCGHRHFSPYIHDDPFRIRFGGSPQIQQKENGSCWVRGCRFVIELFIRRTHTLKP